MKRLLAAFVLCVAPLACLAQSAWTNSYDEAVAASKSSHKPILAYFTGSDWCGWCQKLDKEVFNTSGFQQWADQYVVLLELDFPKHTQQPDELKQQNGQLSGKYHITAFPTVLMLTAKGEVMASQGYEAGGPSKWVADLRQRVNAWMEAHPVDPTKAYEGVPYEKKKLYADKDLRGKQLPELQVEKWLSAKQPKDVEGKVLLIDLWETWCPPCRELIGELNKWSEKYKDDLVVVGLSSETEETVKAFMQKTEMNYFVGVDPKGRTNKEIGVNGIPHVLVVSPDGIVRWQGFPSGDEDPLTEKKLKKIIEAAKADWEASHGKGS